MTSGEYFLAFCTCGRARRGATLGVVSRWAEWHPTVGCEGTEHVVWVGYDPPASDTHIKKGAS